MDDQIKARGWLWDISATPTQWVAYQCHACGNIHTYPHNHIIRVCKNCNWKSIVKIGYVRRVREIKG